MAAYTHLDWLRGHVEPTDDQAIDALAEMADMAACWREAATIAPDAHTAGMACAVSACWQHAHEQPSRDTYIAALTASRVTLARYPGLDVRVKVPSWGRK